MEHYTTQQRDLIVEHYYQNDARLVVTILNNVPNSSAVKKIFEIFESTCLVIDVKQTTRARRVCSEKILTVIREIVA